MKKSFTFYLTVVLGMAGFASFSQELTQEFINAGYTITDLGSINLVPTNYGGLTIRSSEPNTLYIGGAANSSSGAIYKVQLTRETAGHHITGFAGDGVRCMNGENNDGGLFFAPNGVFLYTQYNQNHLGQMLPDSTENSTLLTDYGVSPSVGSVALVPSGFPGAGNLVFASYNAGIFYKLPYSIDASGFYILSYKTAEVDVEAIAPGPEGIAYVPQGSAGFPNLSMLVSSYTSGKVVVFDVGNEGLPNANASREMIIGMTGAEGALIDPVTGDFLFSTFGGGNKIIRVSGFQIPNGTVERISPDFLVKITPNPTTGPITVDVNATGSYFVEISNILGNRIYVQELMGTKIFRYDLSSEPDGIYILKVISGGQSISRKVVKN